MKLSIIIVHYKTYALTKNTINSLLDTINSINYEIFVVDNASHDGSLEKLQNDFKSYSFVKFIENNHNDGFAVANNLGIEKSSGEYILLLNSDVVVKENTINNTLSYIELHDNIGALGCKVLLPNGKLDKACKRSFPTFEVSFYRMVGLSKLFPNSERFNRYNLSYLDENGIYYVDCIVGAFMLLRRDVLFNCNCLDEDYFMYGEDIELCFNIKQLGYDVCYYGKSEIIHYKGASGKTKKTLHAFHESMDIFYTKHYKKSNNFIINFITYFGIWSLYYFKLVLLYLNS